MSYDFNGHHSPKCTAEKAQQIVDLLREDEEARCRWNTLLGRGIASNARDTYVAFQANRRKAAVAKSLRSQRMQRSVV